MASKGEVVEAKPSAIALPEDLRAELAREAKDAAAEERPSISKLSTAGGMLRYGGNQVPNNSLDVIILAAVHRNVYYEGRYNPNDIKNPNCFSLSDSGDDMTPHENVTAPMNPTCKGCKFDEWKSDPNGGKGKACKQSRRLIIIPAGAAESVEAVQKAEMAILDLPVTSAKNYANFVNGLNATAQVPPWAAVANVTVVPDPKTQFSVKLTPLRIAGDGDVLKALKKRVDDAIRIGLTPYDETSETNSAVTPEQKARQQKVDKKLG
jgi:hypothetical protein